MYKKKISTIAIITILTLTTLLAAMPMASAIGTPVLTDSFMGWPVTGGPCYSFIDVEGSGATAFGLVEVYWDSLGTKLGDGYADSAGNFDIEMIIIPFDIVGTHNVIVYDVLSSDTDFETYDITPNIMLMETQALPGDSVMVYGSGFGDELDVQIYLGAFTSVLAEPVTLGGTPVTGTLANAPVEILSVDLTVDVTIDGEVNGVPVSGTGVVTVTDDGEGNLEGATADISVDDGVVVESGEVDVDITGTINYATGVITLVATGVDSAGGTGEVTSIVVTIETPCAADYDYAEYLITPTAGVTTDDTGSFQESILVPAIPEVEYGDYDVTAIDTDGNINVPHPFFPPVLTINYYIELTPDAGPTGITITIEGRIKADTAYELRFNTVPIATGTSGADGSYSGTYVIPAVLSVGLYPVDVVWEVTEIRTADFDLTAPPQVVYAPIAGASGTVVTISTVAGFPFSSDAEISLYLGTTLVNSTADDDRFGPTGGAGPAAGTFTDLEFTVPTLTPGPYALKVIDEYGASTAAIYTFTVLPTPVTTVAPNAASYYPGDTVSFNIFTTDGFTSGPDIVIKDPTGATWWAATWPLTASGPTWSVLYQDQLFGAPGDRQRALLPADAPLGSWNWTVTYTPVSTGVSTKASGLFTVAALPSMQTVIDAVSANTTTLLDAMADLTALLDALDAKITAIDGTVATIDTTLGPISTSLQSLDATITGLDGDIATIQTSVGGVTTSLASIDTVVGSMYGDVLTINTTLGTIEGTIMDMDGTIATIQTDLGTVKLDVAAIETNVDESLPVTVDMLPMWIAVILSLIAAIAAIFAVITIRQKIAG